MCGECLPPLPLCLSKPPVGPDTLPPLQRVQAAGHRTRSVLRAGRRLQQLQGLPRLQEQPLHLAGAGGQEPHPAPQQRAALLQRPAGRHAGDFLSGLENYG